MRIDTYFTVPEADTGSLDNVAVVVIDIIRATTTIVEALANGAREIFPTPSTEEAVRLASSLGREDALLCGERRGLKVEGFDLGNSPYEFTPDVVDGKKLVMSTTNGTRALAAAQEGRRVLVCAVTNLSAVAAAVADEDAVTVMCAGREDRFAVDDALCAGHLIQRVLADRDDDVQLNDASRAALGLAAARKPTRRFFAESAAGVALAEIGLAEDLKLCSDVDRHDIVAVMRDNSITKEGA